MGLFEYWPYSNFHELNADWLLNRVKQMSDYLNNLPDLVRDWISEGLSDIDINQKILDAMTQFGMAINVVAPPNDLDPAKPDGSEEATATIQGCIDYAYAQGGGVVFFPAGRYLTGPLTLKDNVVLLGFADECTKLALKGGSTSPLITADGSNMAVMGLTLDGNAEVQTEDLTLVSMMATDVDYRDVTFTGGYILLSHNLTGGACNVLNCKFNTCVQHAAVFTGAGNLNVLAEFDNLSSAGGESVIENHVDSANMNIRISASAPVGVDLEADECAVTGWVGTGVTTPIRDEGVGNYVKVFGNIKKETYKNKYVDIEADYTINDGDYTHTSENSVETYNSKTMDGPVEINGIFFSKEIVGNKNIIYLPQGTFNITTSITIPDNTTLIGNGTVLTSSDYTVPIITISGDNVKITSITFEMTNKTVTSTTDDDCMVLVTGNNATIENCIFNNIAKRGIYIDISSNGANIINCKFSSNWNYTDWNKTPAQGPFGICCHYNNSIRFKGCNVYNSEFDTLVEGIYVGSYMRSQDSGGCVVSGNRFYNMFDHGCYINGGVGNLVEGNFFSNCNSSIAVEGGRQVVSNNTIIFTGKETNLSSGMSIRDPQNCVITGNLITGYLKEGTIAIDVPQLLSETFNNELFNFVITNNVIRLNANSPLLRIGTAVDAVTSNKNVIISNNIFEGGPGSQLYLMILNNPENYIISNNVFNAIGNATAAVAMTKARNCKVTENIFNNGSSFTTANTISGLVALLGQCAENTVDDNTINVLTTNANMIAFVVRETAENNTRITKNKINTNGNLFQIQSTPSTITATIEKNTIDNNPWYSEFETASGTTTYNITLKGATAQSHFTLIPTDENGANIIKNGYYITSENGLVHITFLLVESAGNFKISE